MTPQHLLGVWESLAREATQPNIGPYLHIQLAGGEIPIGAIFRVADRRAGLLVRLPSNQVQRLPRIESGRGYSIERLVGVSKDTMGMPILVADEKATEIFAAMGADLVTCIEQSKGSAPCIDLVLLRLKHWRQFLQKRVALLTGEECRGLFGEIHILEKVAQIRGFDDALNAWKGPLSQLQDFAFDDSFVEVKTTSTEAGSRITISDPSQIVIEQTRPIYIAVAHLVLGASAAETLGDAVKRIRTKMSELQAQQFNELLANYGFIDAHANDYPDRILVTHVSTYKVQAGFPHIRSADIPGGVVAVKYSIELGALETFRAINHHIDPK